MSSSTDGLYCQGSRMGIMTFGTCPGRPGVAWFACQARPAVLALAFCFLVLLLEDARTEGGTQSAAEEELPDPHIPVPRQGNLIRLEECSSAAEAVAWAPLVVLAPLATDAAASATNAAGPASRGRLRNAV